MTATFESFLPTLEAPDPALGFEVGLRHVVVGMARGLADDEFRRFLPVLLGAAMQADALDDLRRRISGGQRELLVGMLVRGIDEGLLPADLDADEAALLLLGPIILAALDRDRTFDAGLGGRVVDHFLQGVGARPVP